MAASGWSRNDDMFNGLPIEVNSQQQLTNLCYLCSQFRGAYDYIGPDFDDGDREALRRLPSDN